MHNGGKACRTSRTAIRNKATIATIVITTSISISISVSISISISKNAKQKQKQARKVCKPAVNGIW